jgi:hypothetical protein
MAAMAKAAEFLRCCTRMEESIWNIEISPLWNVEG